MEPFDERSVGQPRKRLSAASSCDQSLTAYSKTTENQSESLARLLTSSCETGSQRGSLDGIRKRARRQPANFARTLKLRSDHNAELSPAKHDQSSLLSLVVMIPRLGVHSQHNTSRRSSVQVREWATISIFLPRRRSASPAESNAESPCFVV